MIRTCIKCYYPMEVVKSGFLFITVDGYLFTSDLWACRRCERFQIHGSPGVGTQFSRLISPGKAFFLSDPGNAEMFAILEPELKFSEDFQKHMRKWYPHLEWFEKEVSE